MSRLVVVGGAPRSGTTLVQKVLDSHPDVYGGPESDLIPLIASVYNSAHANIQSGRIVEFFDDERLNEVFRRFVLDIYLPIADRHGCKYVSEKTPFNVFAFPFLLQALPDTRLVYVVRDPRAVFASNLEVAQRYRASGKPLPEFLARPTDTLQMLLNVSNIGWTCLRHFPTRIYPLPYEDLVAKPDETIAELASYLGLPFSAAMRHPETQRHDLERKADDLWYDAAGLRRQIDANSLDKWRDTLTSTQLSAVVETFAEHPLYKAAGYDLRQPTCRQAANA